MHVTGWLRTSRARVALAVGCALLLGAVGASTGRRGLPARHAAPDVRRGAGRGGPSVSPRCPPGSWPGWWVASPPSSRAYPLLYVGLAGGLAGAAGLALGALAGIVVSLDGYRREVHPA